MDGRLVSDGHVRNQSAHRVLNVGFAGIVHYQRSSLVSTHLRDCVHACLIIKKPPTNMFLFSQDKSDAGLSPSDVGV